LRSVNLKDPVLARSLNSLYDFNKRRTLWTVSTQCPLLVRADKGSYIWHDYVDQTAIKNVTPTTAEIIIVSARAGRQLIREGHYGQRPVCRAYRPNTWLHRPTLQT